MYFKWPLTTYIQLCFASNFRLQAPARSGATSARKTKPSACRVPSVALRPGPWRTCRRPPRCCRRTSTSMAFCQAGDICDGEIFWVCWWILWFDKKLFGEYHNPIDIFDKFGIWIFRCLSWTALEYPGILLLLLLLFCQELCSDGLKLFV